MDLISNARRNLQRDRDQLAQPAAGGRAPGLAPRHAANPLLGGSEREDQRVYAREQFKTFLKDPPPPPGTGLVMADTNRPRPNAANGGGP